MQSSLLAVFLTATLVVSAGAQDARPSVPIDPVAGILDAFRTHDIVALGEGAHGNEQGAAFRLALVRDARFAATVNDIVVESGNAKYQDVMDRFVRGEEVPDDVLRQVWQNTTQPHTLWDVPIYEELFRAVRAVNARLPRERRVRVLLGDPPIDWAALQSGEAYHKWVGSPLGDRDRHPAEVIEREVIAKKRRALVVYGDLHFNRRAIRPKPGGPDRSNNLVDLVEQAGAKVFTIHTETFRVDLKTLQPDVASWPKPSLALLQGTVLGKADFTAYYPAKDLIGADGKPLHPRPMEQQFDAVLYLAPPSEITMSRLAPALCADPEYRKMRLGRLTLVGMKGAIDQFHKQCGTAPPGQAGPLASRLLADRVGDWITVDAPGLRIHARRGSAAAADTRGVAELASAARRDVLARLGVPESHGLASPANVFFVNSREDTHKLTGQPLIGFALPDEPTVVFVYTPGYRHAGLLRHELTHLFAFQLWGNPPAGAWLVEGLAVWAAGECQGGTADEFAAGARARGELVSLQHLAAHFREISETVAMPQAGSIVGFLIRRHGLASVVERWRRPANPHEHPLGPDGMSLERAWLDALQAVRPAHPDIPRLIKEGC
jgi:hypothetical protein